MFSIIMQPTTTAKQQRVTMQRNMTARHRFGKNAEHRSVKMKDRKYLDCLYVHLDLSDVFYATKYENYVPETLDVSFLDQEGFEGEEELNDDD